MNSTAGTRQELGTRHGAVEGRKADCTGAGRCAVIVENSLVSGRPDRETAFERYMVVHDRKAMLTLPARHSMLSADTAKPLSPQFSCLCQVC